MTQAPYKNLEICVTAEWDQKVAMVGFFSRPSHCPLQNGKPGSVPEKSVFLVPKGEHHRDLGRNLSQSGHPSSCAQAALRCV